MSKKVAIIIVNWNGLKYLNDCFSAVFKQKNTNFDIYFVDNGSVDGSVGYVSLNFPTVHVVKLEKNEGFARGMNEGIREAVKDEAVKFIVCLNNDTIVSEEWLSELVKTAESDSKIGGVSSKAYFDDGITINNAGLDYFKALQVNRLGGLSIGFGKIDNDATELSKDIEIFAPGGVAPLYKREVVDKLLKRDGEFFDEDFFAYVEDYDVGFRIRSLGYISKLSSSAHLIHLHSKTGGVASPFKAYYGERNAVLTAIKNLPIIDVLLFPIRNIKLKLSYVSKKNSSVERLRGNVGVVQMFGILLKANIVALFYSPKFIWKRLKIKN